MKLSRQHFQMIANVVSTIDNPYTRAMVAEQFADRLGETNPRFDADKFLLAAGAS